MSDSEIVKSTLSNIENVYIEYFSKYLGEQLNIWIFDTPPIYKISSDFNIVGHSSTWTEDMWKRMIPICLSQLLYCFLGGCRKGGVINEGEDEGDLNECDNDCLNDLDLFIIKKYVFVKFLEKEVEKLRGSDQTPVEGSLMTRATKLIEIILIENHEDITMETKKAKAKQILTEIKSPKEYYTQDRSRDYPKIDKYIFILMKTKMLFLKELYKGDIPRLLDNMKEKIGEIKNPKYSHFSLAEYSKNLDELMKIYKAETEAKIKSKSDPTHLDDSEKSGNDDLNEKVKNAAADKKIICST